MAPVLGLGQGLGRMQRLVLQLQQSCKKSFKGKCMLKIEWQMRICSSGPRAYPNNYHKTRAWLWLSLSQGPTALQKDVRGQFFGSLWIPIEVDLQPDYNCSSTLCLSANPKCRYNIWLNEIKGPPAVVQRKNFLQGLFIWQHVSLVSPLHLTKGSQKLLVRNVSFILKTHPNLFPLFWQF